MFQVPDVRFSTGMCKCSRVVCQFWWVGPGWLQLRRVILPLLNYVITEVLPLLLMVSALSSGGSVLGLAGIGSVGLGRSF